MIEYGSDFHYITPIDVGGNTLYNFYTQANLYADGRQALTHLYQAQGWKRIWMPAYFCYEVIGHIKTTGIEVKLYDDYPLREDDDTLVRSLEYREGDVLLRMNYFGLRGWRTNEGIPIPVIEDHTHDLISEWASKSDADYCIESIRKSLPVAAGGILWSPKGLPLPGKVMVTEECEQMAKLRYEAMRMKRDYLQQKPIDKNVFRDRYLTTEKMMDTLRLSGMDRESKRIARSLNMDKWTEGRACNWRIAYERLKDRFTLLKPQSYDYGKVVPFSLIILCDDADERIALRMHLIKHMIYPAILWQVPVDTEFKSALDFSQRMLSVHVDARYNEDDILELCDRISRSK